MEFYQYMMNKKVYIYDIEQFPNFHCNTFMNRDDEKEIVQFVIHKDRDERKEYALFLKNNIEGLIGFNNLEYDYPLLHIVLKNMSWLTSQFTTDEVNMILYDESQRLITTEEYKVIYNPIIPQLDLMKIWHLDNKNKRISLKQLEINMQFDNVQDLPFEYDHIVQENQIEDVKKYNINDCRATKLFYDITIGNTEHSLYKAKDKIQLRKDIKKEYGIECLNYNDVKIGNQIILNEYCKLTNSDYKEIKEKRTYRPIMKGKDIVSNRISFKTPEFNRILNQFKDLTITSTKLDDASKELFSLVYKGFKYDFGLGGIHGSSKGIFEAKDNWIIYDDDVASFYPSAGIILKLYPQHLGSTYTTVYKGLRDKRVKAKHEGKMSISEALKLAMNGGAYGKSNASDNFMYDPIYTMRTTI